MVAFFKMALNQDRLLGWRRSRSIGSGCGLRLRPGRGFASLPENCGCVGPDWPRCPTCRSQAGPEPVRQVTRTANEYASPARRAQYSARRCTQPRAATC